MAQIKPAEISIEVISTQTATKISLQFLECFPSLPSLVLTTQPQQVQGKEQPKQTSDKIPEPVLNDAENDLWSWDSGSQHWKEKVNEESCIAEENLVV